MTSSRSHCTPAESQLFGQIKGVSVSNWRDLDFFRKARRQSIEQRPTDSKAHECTENNSSNALNVRDLGVVQQITKRSYNCLLYTSDAADE